MNYVISYPITNPFCGSDRYHFNGKEHDNEWSGNSGDSYDFGARMYDSRLGRWTRIDPNYGIFAFISPYAGLANNPNLFIDPTGGKVILVPPKGQEDKKDYVIQKYRDVVKQSFGGKVVVDVDQVTGEILGYSIVEGKEQEMSAGDYEALDQLNAVVENTTTITMAVYDHTMEGSENVEIDGKGQIDLDDIMDGGSMDENKPTRKGMLVHAMVENMWGAEHKETLNNRKHIEACKAENKCQQFKRCYNRLGINGTNYQELDFVEKDGQTSWFTFAFTYDESGEVTGTVITPVDAPPFPDQAKALAN